MFPLKNLSHKGDIHDRLRKNVPVSLPQVACPPLQQRSAWGAPQPLTFLQNGAPPYASSNGLPQLATGTKNPTMTWAQAPNNLPVPRPPGTTLRSRPLSAGSAGTRRITTITSEIQPAQQRGNGSFWLSAQPMRGGVNMQWLLSLAEPSLHIVHYTVGCLLWILSEGYFHYFWAFRFIW